MFLKTTGIILHQECMQCVCIGNCKYLFVVAINAHYDHMILSRDPPLQEDHH